MAALARASGAGLWRQFSTAGAGVCRRGFASETGSIEIEVEPFQTFRCDAPTNKIVTNKEELLGFFETMYKIRRMEIASDMLYKAKLIRGFCHLYDGQEAVITGLTAGSTFQDSIITSYRDHALHLVRGGTVKEVIGELLGRTVGASKGVGGSMHMYNKKNNFYGGCGIVGAQVPVGAGLGLAHKLKKDGNCSFALYGDGAANQGQIAESFNMCAIWDVPTVFVCENNHYGMGTADYKGAKSSSFYKRGDYIPGIKVDGMDVLAMKAATVFAKDWAVTNGPIIMEADTYRYHGHSMSDPGSTYRTRDEVSTMRKGRDPVDRVKKLLLQHELIDPKDLAKLEKSIKSSIEKDIEACKAAPIPDEDVLTSNIYAKPDGQRLRAATSGGWYTAITKEY